QRRSRPPHDPPPPGAQADLPSTKTHRDLSRFQDAYALLYSPKASPSDHIAAPSRTTSFSKNSPGVWETAGKPPRLGSHPGVENKNESVVRNISTARALPIADAFLDQGRRAIKIAMTTSTTPNPAANCRTVHMLYTQPKNGLFATSGSMFCASYPVNFI